MVWGPHHGSRNTCNKVIWECCWVTPLTPCLWTGSSIWWLTSFTLRLSPSDQGLEFEMWCDVMTEGIRSGEYFRTTTRSCRKYETPCVLVCVKIGTRNLNSHSQFTINMLIEVILRLKLFIQIFTPTSMSSVLVLRIDPTLSLPSNVSGPCVSDPEFNISSRRFRLYLWSNISRFSSVQSFQSHTDPDRPRVP